MEAFISSLVLDSGLVNLKMDSVWDRVEAKLNIKRLHEYQKDVLTTLLTLRDVFVCKKTGAGKSLCYLGFTTAMDKVEKSVVIVVSPLLEIMKEQCEYMKKAGITAAILGKDEDDDEAMLACDVQYVFASPEHLLGDAKWRTMIKSAGDNGYLNLFVIDEAHLILQW